MSFAWAAEWATLGLAYFHLGIYLLKAWNLLGSSTPLDHFIHRSHETAYSDIPYPPPPLHIHTQSLLPKPTHTQNQAHSKLSTMLQTDAHGISRLLKCWQTSLAMLHLSVF